MQDASTESGPSAVLPVAWYGLSIPQAGPVVRCHSERVHLAAAVYSGVSAIQAVLGESLAKSTSIEGAARIWLDAVYEPLAEALVLARVFAILPRSALPPFEAEHADRVAGAAGHALDARSPVLSLLATRGARPEWNERLRSQVHLALPLASSALLEASPMIASLLDDMGVRLTTVSWGPRLVSTAREVPEHPTFYVADALTTTDPRGRFKIPARDFVFAHDVKSVFGVGGTLGGGTLFAMVLFARQHVTRAVAEQLAPLAAEFRSATLPIAGAGQGKSRSFFEL